MLHLARVVRLVDQFLILCVSDWLNLAHWRLFLELCGLLVCITILTSLWLFWYRRFSITLYRQLCIVLVSCWCGLFHTSLIRLLIYWLIIGSCTHILCLLFGIGSCYLCDCVIIGHYGLLQWLILVVSWGTYLTISFLPCDIINWLNLANWWLLLQLCWLLYLLVVLTSLQLFCGRFAIVLIRDLCNVLFNSLHR